jgi:hypothetical protein
MHLSLCAAPLCAAHGCGALAHRFDLKHPNIIEVCFQPLPCLSAPTNSRLCYVFGVQLKDMFETSEHLYLVMELYVSARPTPVGRAS